jgi:hypothetical protein
MSDKKLVTISLDRQRDSVLIGWLDAQENQSAAVRQAVRFFIEHVGGYDDAAHIGAGWKADLAMVVRDAVRTEFESLTAGGDLTVAVGGGGGQDVADIDPDDGQDLADLEAARDALAGLGS